MTDFSAALSVPTIDERAWRATEPHTPNPRARLEAVAELTARGDQDRGAGRAADARDQRRPGSRWPRSWSWRSEAGAAYVSGIALHLRGEVRQVFMEWLQANRPDLVDRYRELYRGGAYAPVQERRRLARLLERGPDPSPPRTSGGRFATRSEPPEAAPEPEQARLF